METKPRILYLQKILLERTDEENPLSTTQLINILNDEYGISAHRTTVTKDIAALQEFGMDIVTIHSTQSKYFVASRKFELPELKLLIDAVSPATVVWIIAEGVCYITGALFYTLRKRRYMHTVFHFFVLAGSVCHLIAVWDILMRYLY